MGARYCAGEGELAAGDAEIAAGEGEAGGMRGGVLHVHHCERLQ
jgi:hypothetical protein